MNDERFLKELNPAQREAVCHIDSPLLIVAGPGSGKTRVIVHRIAYLVHTVGINPWRICAVTFTNKAARELKSRLSLLLGLTKSDQVVASTFHALCSRILRENGQAIGLSANFTIYDDDDQIALIKRAFEENDLDRQRFSLRAVLGAISHAKAHLIDVDGYKAQATAYFELTVAKIYDTYQQLLERNRAVDFDDLLAKTYQLLNDHPKVLHSYQERFLHFLVDEFQDTNMAQYFIAQQLAGHWRNICVVGDPDQSIYAWRNADLRNILSFQKDYPDAHLVTLEENYRSTRNILDAAQSVIEANTQRFQKRLLSKKPTGAPLIINESYTEREEAAWVLEEVERLRTLEGHTYGDVAITYRVNAQSRAVEEACIRYGIPYRLIGTTRFYHRREIKDLMAYLRLLENPSDDVSVTRIINVPPRRIGKRTIYELTRWARAHGTPLLESISLITADRSISPEIPEQGVSSLAEFSKLLKTLANGASGMTVAELVDFTIDRTKYRTLLETQDQGEERLDNLAELRSAAAEFDHFPRGDGLAAFLERAALVSEIDNLEEDGQGVTLITLHQAKGLEFPVVFMIGMEEGLLPHFRSLDTSAEIEEERRLCYVGMTRAKERLYLVRAFRRSLMGTSGTTVPSRFLQEIPEQLVGFTRHKENEVPTRKITDRLGSHTKPPEYPQDGDRVVHRTFGEGVVMRCTPSGQDYEITVAFKTSGVKRLLGSIAQLERVTEEGNNPLS
jgi:DNA helicase-2/ATP-dependent DNA helicase PcrA